MCLKPVVPATRARSCAVYFRARMRVRHLTGGIRVISKPRGSSMRFRIPTNQVLQDRSGTAQAARTVRNSERGATWFYAQLHISGGKLEAAETVIAKVEWHRESFIPVSAHCDGNMSRPAERVVRVLNKALAREQWIRRGQGRDQVDTAGNATFAANACGSQLHGTSPTISVLIFFAPWQRPKHRAGRTGR